MLYRMFKDELGVMEIDELNENVDKWNVVVMASHSPEHPHRLLRPVKTVEFDEKNKLVVIHYE